MHIKRRRQLLPVGRVVGVPIAQLRACFARFTARSTTTEDWLHDERPCDNDQWVIALGCVVGRCVGRHSRPSCALGTYLLLSSLSFIIIIIKYIVLTFYIIIISLLYIYIQVHDNYQWRTDVRTVQLVQFPVRPETTTNVLPGPAASHYTTTGR